MFLRAPLHRPDKIDGLASDISVPSKMANRAVAETRKASTKALLKLRMPPVASLAFFGQKPSAPPHFDGPHMALSVISPLKFLHILAFERLLGLDVLS